GDRPGRIRVACGTADRRAAPGHRGMGGPAALVSTDAPHTASTRPAIRRYEPMSIETAEQLAGMTRAGRVVAETVAHLARTVRPGMTTGELDAEAERFLAGRGARSAPELHYGFPGTTCLSVNDEIVHGVPGNRRIGAADLVKIDVTAQVDGYIADSAVSVPMPDAPPVARRLAACAREAFTQALRAVRAGHPVSGIGAVVERVVRRRGFRVLRELAGHGVGRAIHEPPDVPNWPQPGRAMLRD